MAGAAGGWLRASPGLTNGIHAVNSIDASKFEQFLNRVVSDINTPSADIFTSQERSKLEKIFKSDEKNVLLIIKTVHYLLKRMLKFILKPVHLKKDLTTLGLDDEKADMFVKVWSAETRTTLNDVAIDFVGQQKDALNIKWKLSAEVSSDIVKKSKVPIVNISLGDNDPKSAIELELTHQELYGMFLQMEAIQTELDSLM